MVELAPGSCRLSTAERFLTVIAGFGTLLNLAITFGGVTNPPSFASGFGDVNVSLRITIVFLLETVLAYGIGFLFSILIGERYGLRDFGPVQIIGGLAIATGSAWVSYFNLIVILLGGAPLTEGKVFGLFILGLLAFFWNAIIGSLHGIERDDYQGHFFSIGFAQVIPWIILYIGMVIDLAGPGVF